MLFSLPRDKTLSLPLLEVRQYIEDIEGIGHGNFRMKLEDVQEIRETETREGRKVWQT
jgi:hypothetical protein